MKWLLSKQIRARLTLWYVAVLAMILAVYIVLVFVFQYKLVSNQIFHDEVQDVETVEGLLYFDPRGMLQLRQDYFSHPRSHLLIDRLMEVRNLSGATLYRTPSLHDMPLGGPSFADEGEDSFNQRTETLADGSRVSVISHTHSMQGRTVVIRLGYSLAPFRERMTQFTEILLIALPIALLVAALAGYQIARRALEPIKNMAQKAQHITAHNLHDRLQAGNPDDELGYMASVFNDLLNRLELTFKQLNRFTADASHELRAPLAAIRSIGEISLRQEQRGGNDKEAIVSILEEAARLEETIAGLLLLARAEAAQALGPNTFSLFELSHEVLTLLDVLAEERGINIITDLPPSGGVIVRGDRSLIRSAVMNVVHNAIKFSPADAMIKISHSTASASDGFIELTIEDQGPGVQASERDDVFERFYTSPRRQTASHSGTGLGLSIAKLVIQRSGGEIFFADDLVVGARCVIRLPAHHVSTS